MERKYKIDKWKIIEEGFDPSRQRASESVFSLGNGHMGLRANFEESYSGDSMQGSYIGGIYYPDKTKVGWWKNGYPEYFAKVINSVNWIGIDIMVNGLPLDLADCEVSNFQRVLDMKKGLLERSFTAKLTNGNKVRVEATRFVSMKRPEAGAISYSISALNFDGKITFTPYLDGAVTNEDSNYDEQFWEEIDQQPLEAGGVVHSKTKKTDFHVAAAMKCDIQKNGVTLQPKSEVKRSSQYIARQYAIDISEGDQLKLRKYAIVASSLNHERKRLHSHVFSAVEEAQKIGFNRLLEEQETYWADKWATCDVKIKGDPSAQQGIRFNIFQLYQTYTGVDERLNIGPKGFTGEKYGGVTYWDTEAYCLPFYLCTAGQKIAKQLLRYRYRHLGKAIKNAEKLGFNNGAALYPMVTMSGEECHNEWEITFEEIHRNGAIAYAIYNYIGHTGDRDYLHEGGLEVLIAISRFWSQRFNFSEKKHQYVMLGVTGPNEYENNVNNNWYTSYIACWTMRYTLQCLEEMEQKYPDKVAQIRNKTAFKDEETSRWEKILLDVYLPEENELGIFLQQDGYMDKIQRTADELDHNERPINQHWSWDRILRSCFIKQGDVIQGLYFFEDHFDEDTIKQNFDFYEPRTVHESSLSPCIHSILASRLGYSQKAYELYLRTARLDLDDYNKEVHQGLHVTSMAGTWMAIAEGFAGKRIEEGELHFDPSLPQKWEGYSFKMIFRNRLLKLQIDKQKVTIACEAGRPVDCYVYGQKHHISEDEPAVISQKGKANIST